jgi:RNA ligase
VSFKLLDKYTDEKFLRKVIAPCGKLVLYGYTDKCTFERKWNKTTLNARGTIYEIETGKIVARAFSKFFNFEELPTSKSRNLAKKTNFETFEKVDGSLGILYYYDGKWSVNTRGSFSSDQANEAQYMLRGYNLSTLDPEYTYMVEIIYPENKIIVDYGSQRKLTLLAALETESGDELPWEILEYTAKNTGFDIVKRYKYSTIEDLINDQKDLPSTEEGFVVRFSDGYRVKFKSKEYLKLAALLSHMTPLHFWKHMKGGKIDQELLEKFPEEFREESDNIAKSLHESYLDVFYSLHKEAGEVLRETVGEENQRKAIGLKLKGLKHGAAVFSVIDGNHEKEDQYIMKKIRPSGNDLANPQ